MLSLLQKLRNKLDRATSTTVPKMDSEARMGHDDSPASVWIPSSALAERHHFDRNRSFRRQLSRKLSSRAKQISNSTCNATACAIAVCFVTAILALIVSCFTFYMYVKSHGLGHEMRIIEEAFNPNPDSRHGASPSPRFDGPQTTMPPPSHEGAAKSAYAHIVGTDNGPRGNDRQLECLSQWKANATHNVNFLGTYGIEIVEPGYYYVYTQIYFSDSVIPSSQQALPMRSSTNRNHVPLMESVVPFKEYATKYHGGVFHLDKGDKITVSVSDNELRINTGSDKTFFGVFMLRSTMPDQGTAAAS